MTTSYPGSSGSPEESGVVSLHAVGPTQAQKGRREQVAAPLQAMGPPHAMRPPQAMGPAQATGFGASKEVAARIMGRRMPRGGARGRRKPQGRHKTRACQKQRGRHMSRDRRTRGVATGLRPCSQQPPATVSKSALHKAEAHRGKLGPMAPRAETHVEAEAPALRERANK